MPSHGRIARRNHIAHRNYEEMGTDMSENDQAGTSDLEEAAKEGPLPGVEEADAAEEEGRDTSEIPGSDPDPDSAQNKDAPAGGVVMGAVNQH
jgi:hypothetical protein